MEEPRMEETMRDVLAISPHLDDAVLSAGGRIADLASAGMRVTVFTVFAGDPSGPYSALARSLHKTWGLPREPVSHRRGEDGRGLGCLRARPVHGTELDAIYRKNADGGWLVDNGTWPTEHDTKSELELTSRITATVTEVIATLRPELVLTCASIGGHIDHRHTCDAVRAATAATATPLQLWTDMPYSQEHLRELPPDVAVRTGEYGPEPFFVSDDAWARKLRAIAAYESQHSMLWPGATDVYEVIGQQAAGLALAYGQAGRCELSWRELSPVARAPGRVGAQGSAIRP
jgi:LmbE family N-acetylglucosaminyl deacetylase